MDDSKRLITLVQRTSDNDTIEEEHVTLLHRQTSSFSEEASGEPSLPPPPPPPPRRTPKISSLDFERVVNEYSIQATRDRFLLTSIPEVDEELYTTGRTNHESVRDARKDAPTHHPPTRRYKIKTGRTATRWALSAIVGLFTGLATIILVEITSLIIAWRIKELDASAQSHQTNNARVFGEFLLLNLVMAVTASALCVFVAPEGTGSGIPETKAYLNGVRVKKFTSWRLLAVKVVGTILSVSSSLAVGMEGPLIHIGAIIGASFTKLASVMSRWLSTSRRDRGTPNSAWTQSLWNFTTTNLAHFSIDAERRDLVAIGASVGFAASFGAPIGGLLFILDDVSSYFSKNMFLRVLVANAIGTFCLAIQSGNMSHYSIIDFYTYSGAKPTDDIFLNRIEFTPLYIVVGVGGGILGGLFCASFAFLKVNVTDRLTTPAAKLLQVAILSIVTSALLFGLPIMAWTCKSLADDNTIDHGREFFCNDGEVNEMATIVFGSRTDGIKRILSDPNQFQERTLWTVGIVFYGLMTITFGSIIPSGIFTPTVLIGASLGGATGLAFQRCLTPDIIPSTFALLGVAAMLAGIQRSTVSVSVILVEGTGKIQVLLPTIIVVLVARYVAQQISSRGIYEVAMELKKYPYLDHEERKRYDMITISEIMSCPAEVIGPLEKANHLVRMLQLTSHNGFPVVDPRSKKFLGLVRRDQIIALLECGLFEGANITIKDGRNLERPSDLSTLSTPKPGIGKSPMMHWAFHIKDDRYDHLQSQTNYFPDDEFDRHEWIRNVHNSLHIMPSEVATELADNTVPTAGDDALPPMRRIFSSRLDKRQKYEKLRASKAIGNAAPDGFANVGVDDTGNLIVSWLAPDCRDKYVNLSAVMNRGSFCVPEHLPVSNARLLFTKLGLRHVVVVGGKSGGEVVGIFTRANLMASHIEARTGIS